MVYLCQILVVLYYINLQGNHTLMSAVGLGNMIISTFGVSFFYGLNGSVETLVSQANGAGNQYMCGVYLQTGRLVALIAFIPVCLMFYGSYRILQKNNIDKNVCHNTGLYLMSNVFGILFFGLFDVQRRFLTQFGMAHKPFILQIIQFFFTWYLVHELVHRQKLNALGTGYATTLSNFLLLISCITLSNN